MIRLLDLFLSIFALLILTPLLLPVIFILKLTGERKVFFRQVRVGRYQKKIKIYKFATMLENSPHMGTGTITMKDDPRILPFGKYLRKTKINELPQLINILIGDMSFVGPRPLTENNFAYYDKTQREMISQVRPGLSGVGSIIFRNEEEILNNQSGVRDFYRDKIAPYKAEVEIWFVQNYKFSINCILILLTILIVVMPKRQHIWQIFPSLPRPPKDLETLICSTNYKD